MGNKNGDTVAVIAAHPDDEVLGCGGTMAKHSESGDEVHVLILAEGVTSRDEVRDPQMRQDDLDSLRKASYIANDLLGVKSLSFENFPDNRMDSVDLLDIVKKVEEFLYTYQPSIVYTHFGGDLNVDHAIVNNAVITACRPVPDSAVRTILFFEVPSSTEWQINSTNRFIPNWYIDITATLNIKAKAIELYESEMHSWPHSRSLEGVKYLSRWRGASIGVDTAEAFQLGRNLII